jgi:hypothetical protein
MRRSSVMSAVCRTDSPPAGRIGDDDVRVALVTADVGVDERAERHDAEPALARVVQGSGDERRAEAPALHSRVDFRVQERDDIPASIAVDELAHRLAREQQFVAALVGLVHDLEIVVGQGGEGTGGERRAYEPSR